MDGVEALRATRADRTVVLFVSSQGEGARVVLRHEQIVSENEQMQGEGERKYDALCDSCVRACMPW